MWRPFWVLPSAIAGFSLLLGIVLPLLDALIGEPSWVFEGGPDGARGLLGTIAGAMISVTGLVFSITILILQLASSQFTPRILRTFLDDRIPQVTLGVFTGSFLYALTVLRSVRGDERAEVPQTAVTLSYLYVVVAVGMFLAFINHITRSVQVSHVMSRVRRRTVLAAHRLTERPQGSGAVGAGWSPRPGAARTDLRLDDRCGYVTVLDSTMLVERAARLGVVAELDVTPGDFLVTGQVVGRGWQRDDLTEEEVDGLTAVLRLEDERDFVADPGYGVRQLLDIAERALSPAVNDPTTGVQAINELHVVFRDLAVRPDPSPYLTDDRGEVHAVYRPTGYAALLTSAVDELAHYGAESVRVVPRLREMLEDLAGAATPEHRAVTEAALDRLEEG
ncbi:MAG TPA: DUF2254 domain-containing protein [Marmoricola sp.]|nr:DUF2254 domain-containing protein [Marmoricola sp.]